MVQEPPSPDWGTRTEPVSALAEKILGERSVPWTSPVETLMSISAASQASSATSPVERDRCIACDAITRVSFASPVVPSEENEPQRRSVAVTSPVSTSRATRPEQFTILSPMSPVVVRRVISLAVAFIRRMSPVDTEMGMPVAEEARQITSPVER